MKKLWQREYYFRASDFDKFDTIKPSAVLDLFQDAAGQHAEEIGVGFADMINRGYLWVLTRVKYEIISAPARYQNVIVKTWPLEPNRLNYKREYCIEDQNGNLLIKGTSEWVVIDNVKRRFLSVPDLYPFTDGFHNEIMFPEKSQKIRDFETVDSGYFINSGFSDLDVNNHVNNIKYADYILNAINPQSKRIISSFQIDYRKEVLEGAKLEILYTLNENKVTAKGLNENEDIAFICEMQYK